MKISKQEGWGERVNGVIKKMGQVGDDRWWCTACLNPQREERNKPLEGSSIDGRGEGGK